MSSRLQGAFPRIQRRQSSRGRVPLPGLPVEAARVPQDSAGPDVGFDPALQYSLVPATACPASESMASVNAEATRRNHALEERFVNSSKIVRDGPARWQNVRRTGSDRPRLISVMRVVHETMETSIGRRNGRLRTRSASLTSVVVKSVDVVAVRRAADDYARHLLESRPDVEEIIMFGSFATNTYAPGSDLDVFILLSDSDLAVRDRIPGLLPVRFPIGVDVFPFTRAEVERMEHAPLLAAVRASTWRYSR